MKPQPKGRKNEFKEISQNKKKKNTREEKGRQGLYAQGILSDHQMHMYYPSVSASMAPD